MWWLPLLLLQDVQGQAERIRAAMQSALAQQRASVERQARSLVKPRSPRPLRIPERASLEPPCEPVAPSSLDQMIEAAAQQHEVDAGLMREVAREESAFYPCAVSSQGAEGLMQLMPETQTQFEVQNPFDPEQSLSAGAALLKQLLERYNGDLPLVLSAYNAGTTRVDQAAAIPQIPETRQYVSDILNRLKGLPFTPRPVK